MERYTKSNSQKEYVLVITQYRVQYEKYFPSSEIFSKYLNIGKISEREKQPETSQILRRNISHIVRGCVR